MAELAPLQPPQAKSWRVQRPGIEPRASELCLGRGLSLHRDGRAAWYGQAQLLSEAPCNHSNTSLPKKPLADRHGPVTAPQPSPAQSRPANLCNSRSSKDPLLLFSHHAVAAADAEHLAGDPAGMRGGKHCHHRRDVPGPPEATQRIEPDQLLAIGLDPVAVMRGFDEAQRYDVHRRAETAEI